MTLLPNINRSEIRQKLNVTEAENNPFFSVRDSNCSYRELVKSYKESEEYWNEQISRKFSRRNLER